MAYRDVFNDGGMPADYGQGFQRGKRKTALGEALSAGSQQTTPEQGESAIPYTPGPVDYSNPNVRYSSGQSQGQPVDDRTAPEAQAPTTGNNSGVTSTGQITPQDISPKQDPSQVYSWWANDPRPTSNFANAGDMGNWAREYNDWLGRHGDFDYKSYGFGQNMYQVPVPGYMNVPNELTMNDKGQALFNGELGGTGASYAYNGPFAGFDSSRMNADNAKNGKYYFAEVAKGFDPWRTHTDRAYAEQMLAELNKNPYGITYTLSPENDFMARTPGEAYDGAYMGGRPMGYDQGAAWDEGNKNWQWQWLSAEGNPAAQRTADPGGFVGNSLQGALAAGASGLSGSGSSSYTPGIGAAPAGVNSAGWKLLQDLLNQPLSLNDDVIAKMKEAQKETMVGMSNQYKDRELQSLASRGMADSGMTSATERDYADKLTSGLTGAYRDIDIKKAMQDKADIINALNTWMQQQGIWLDERRIDQFASQWAGEMAFNKEKWADQMKLNWTDLLNRPANAYYEGVYGG